MSDFKWNIPYSLFKTMFRGTSLTEAEKVQIMFGRKKIAKVINRTEKVIRNFVKLNHKYETKAKNCSVRKISTLQGGCIRHEAF
jgi:hypothetical protein